MPLDRDDRSERRARIDKLVADAQAAQQRAAAPQSTMTTSRACPACHERSGVALDMTIDGQYFECSTCGHLWKAVESAAPSPGEVPQPPHDMDI